MAEYECPECGGGFPANPDHECPWCGTSIDGSVSTGLDLGTTTLSQRLDSGGNRTFGGRPDGTTECPECGDEMPKLKWTVGNRLCTSCLREKRNEQFDPGFGAGRGGRR